MRDYTVHLENSAERWDNATPLGNGASGLMVYGGVGEERLSFNEESIWSGDKTDTKVEGYYDKIKHVRELFLEDREYEADKWADENMKDCFFNVKSYEYAGEVYVKFHNDVEAECYSRDLDIINGICTIKYKINGAEYKREYFASYPASLICARYTASEKFSAVLRYQRENIVSLNYNRDKITAECVTVYGEHHFTISVSVVTDGERSVTSGGVFVKDASYIELYTVISTNFKHDDMSAYTDEISKNINKGWDALLDEHITDFATIMKRSDIHFDSDPNIDDMTIPLRLKRLDRASSYQDYGLLSLYWQFGKYLLLGSSRKGTLPANLQGVWADGLLPPWNADYHTNINLQMNYWHAEESNIEECISPLFEYMNNYLMPGGARVARENYHSRGIVVHHLSDIYGFAAAADGLWGLWPLGGAWLAYHMWEHYLYCGDVEFLRNTAYKFIKGCTLFFVDNMFEGKDGYLHTGPSTSPENSYYKVVDGERRKIFLAMSPTMDIEIIGGLFDFYIQIEDILGIDPETAAKVREMKSRMVPLRIGKHGQIMEWLYDYDEEDPGHRHISHAFALYPAAQINHSTPELFNAMEKTLERRLSFGGGHTGWSRAWLINLFARLGRADRAYFNVRELFRQSTFPNLFDAHPPFQIDGNFGGSAGIGEMVMQSHEGYISIIPAVPDFLSGSFEGLRARGGYTVSAEWREGRVLSVHIKSDTPSTVKLLVPGHDMMDVFVNGETFFYF